MANPPTTRIIAARVRAAMRDTSEVALADATGIPRSTLRRRLTGNSDFTTRELTAICEYLDTSLLSLLADEPNGVPA